MSYIDRDGVRIYFEATGEGHPILWSHGYSATAQMWQGQVEALAPSYRMIVWDMRGHGQSDSPEDTSEYSESATVGDMSAILDACHVEQAVVGGLSLGGYMSLAFHLAHPERVRALMLFDTGPGFRKDEARATWNQRAEGIAQGFEELGLGGLGAGAEVRVSAHRSADGLAKAARGMLAQRDGRVMESLPTIDVPTLALVGENDTPFLAGTSYMASKIPGATHVVIPGAGHASNIDQPEAFNREVKEFLCSIE
jgi:pimeloyl-ACP methyl ester carboxylesterase